MTFDPRPKEMVNSLFKKTSPQGLVFIPLICSFAAKLRGISVKKMFTNPTYLANSLRDAQKLFGFDAITNIFDPSLEAEALGCQIEWVSDEKLPSVMSHPLADGKGINDLDQDFEKKGRVPLVLEATKRINILMGKELSIIGVVTGPLTLGKHLKGDTFLTGLKEDSQTSKEVLDFAGKISLKVANLYCELGLNTILIVEQVLNEVENLDSNNIRLVYESIWNVLRFYRANSLFLAHGCKDNQVESICGLGVDGVMINGQSQLLKAKGVSQKYGVCFSGNIPTEVLISEPKQKQLRESVMDYLRIGGEEKGFFLSTEWEMPYSTHPQNIHELMRIVREL